MPGSATAPGRPGTRAGVPGRVAFRIGNGVGTRNSCTFAAQWLAYALPCRRFAAALAGANARLGAGVDRYSFTVMDLHHLLLAGLPAHYRTAIIRTWDRNHRRLVPTLIAPGLSGRTHAHCN